MPESDFELARRMREQAAIQCQSIINSVDTEAEMVAKAWMAGARWMLFELQPPTEERPRNAIR